MIAELREQYPVQRLREVLDCPRNSYYYQTASDDEIANAAAIEHILARYPYYGYRRVQA